MFACEHFNLEPDIMCVAKSLAGVIPIGAILLNEKAINIPKKSRGSTFGGNPLACAVALANIRFLLTGNLNVARNLVNS
jgi:acetylornithine/succinyldiaminopimelate/putrescine aminotransferase